MKTETSSPIRFEKIHLDLTPSCLRTSNPACKKTIVTTHYPLIFKKELRIRTW